MAVQPLIRVLRQAVERQSERIALHFDDRSWTYAELDRQVDALAAGLLARGIQRGDRVAFLLPNGPELVFLNLACLKVGAVAVPLNNRLKGAELAYILGHCRARLCVVHTELFANLEPALPELKQLERLFVVGGSPFRPGCAPFEDLAANSPAHVSWGDSNLDDPAAILYTSGTTARPKGVTHTHRSLAATTGNYVEAVGMNGTDVILGLLSMSHIFGYTLQLLSPLTAGATVVVTSRFDAPEVLGLIHRHRVSHLYGLPVMFEALARDHAGGPTDLTSLRYCLAGGDSVSRRLSAAVRESLGVELYEGCGMTEVIPYALNRPRLENRIGSIGPPSVGMRLRLVDETGRDVPDGQPGEILVRSEAVTAGYWEDPDATAQSLRDGWFHTGDIGRRDEAGYYWFVGRRKEIIVRGGSNISPLEVEAAVAQHPAVQDAAVVGAPHPSLGEIVAAFVVLKPGATSTEQDLRQFAAERIASYKVPEQIRFLAELPRGLTGKVQRKTLKEWAAAGSGG